jgi:hypothetical protein
MKVFAPVDHRRKQSNADRSAEVAHHVRQGRGIGRIAGGKIGGRELRQGNGKQRLAGSAQKLRQDQLVHANVVCQVHIDKAARRKKQRAGDDENAGIEPLHQERHGWEQDELRQAAPHHDIADLQRGELDDGGDRTGNEIQVENIMPGEIVGQSAADCRTDGRSKGRRQTKEGDAQSLLRRWQAGADNGDGGRNENAPGETLAGAKDDQLGQ